MSEKLTAELLNELLFTSSLESFLNENDDIEQLTIAQYLNYLISKKKFKKSDIIKKSGLNPTFAYQIFSGDRQASRNKLLQLVFAMRLTLHEAQQLLKSAGINELYCKDRRDAIIIYCILHQMNLESADNTLFQFGEATICDP